ncbi:MAG TPA: SAM-dependent methyltransferase, partial [Acidobacteria bacterium]|nr:SAM-dependent methyltransferase [Acidobacteriota bacterium]
MSGGGQLTLMTVTKQLPTWTPDPDGEHGEVFTRRWVVDLILDAVGYRVDADLGARTLVEPSCGCGAFMVPIVERLIESSNRHDRALADLEGAVRGFDLLENNAEHTRKAVMATLVEAGETLETAERLSAAWVTTGDFLLVDHVEGEADFVVGNPPYIRLEDLPPAVSDAYRGECATMRGRADIFVGFFEKGLSLLAAGGRLGFICADRWMRNQYGARLRELVAEQYAVESIVVMHDVDAFEDEVSAYPAITVLRKAPQGPAKVVDADASFDESASRRLGPWLSSESTTAPEHGSFVATELGGWFTGSGHWPAGSPHTLALLADLEARFAPLENPLTRTRVGIGLATGCDEVFIVDTASQIEHDRLLPLLTAEDIASGEPNWAGRCLVNPWDDGQLV